MLHQRPILFLIAMFALVSLACNAFAGNVEPENELPPPTFVVTFAPGEAATVEGAAPTVTLPGTEVAEGTAVPPIEGPYVTMLVDLNVRNGPGVQYGRVGFLLQGESAPLLGQDPTSGWWKIQCPATITTNECWVSGGSEYSQATDAESVPVAPAPPSPTPPPTPTPPPPTAEPSTDVADGEPGLVAYADEMGLWVVPVNLSQSLPTAGTPLQLIAGSDISNPVLSPDGEKVAYLRGSSLANELGFVYTDGEEGGVLATSASLPNASGSADTAVLIDQVQWLPDSQALAFSSTIVFQNAPGILPQADLWTVPLDGEAEVRFAPGEGGHTFNISPDGAQVIFGLPESIVQANMDGTNRQTVLEFAFVNTASEYAYAPTVQWLANGNTAVTAVSSADPWQPSASATLYRIQNGNAFVNGNVNGNILFNPVLWPPDGSQTAYVQFIPDGSNTQTLILADSSGAAPEAYQQAQNMTLFGWNPGGSQVLYTGDGFISVGQAGIEPVELPLPAGISDAQWLNDAAFMMVVGQDASWNLASGDTAGEMELLTAVSGSNVQMDVWTP